MQSVIHEIFLLVFILILLYICMQFFPRQKPVMMLSFTINNKTIKGVIKMIQLRDGQQQGFKVSFLDREGQETTVEAGTVQITSSNPAVAEIIADPEDETKFTLKALSPGTCQVDVSADAIEGEGTRVVGDFAAVEVRAGEAVGVGISATGEPEPYDVVEEGASS